MVGDQYVSTIWVGTIEIAGGEWPFTETRLFFALLGRYNAPRADTFSLGTYNALRVDYFSLGKYIFELIARLDTSGVAWG